MSDLKTWAEFIDLLTERELIVANGVLTGMSNPLIGERFSMSHQTVRAHLGNVYRKLGLKGKDARRELVTLMESLEYNLSSSSWN